MRLANIVHLYRVRLRSRLAHEAFAVLGIAAGVALLLSAQIASESLTSSVATLARGVDGNASLQLLARSPQGMPEDTLAAVRATPGVRSAAPLLEAPAQAAGPRGQRSVQLIGADSSLRALGGALVAHTEVEPIAGVGAVLLPAPLADSLGVTRYGQELTLRLYGRAVQAPLYAQLTARTVGAIAESPVVLAPLPYAQELTGEPGRITRILIAPRSGARRGVEARLQRLAGSSLALQGTGYQQQLFATAAASTDSSTSLFALISALVGFLFAANATLMTLPSRRRLIAELRRDGYPNSALAAILSFDALILGLFAGAIGLAAGAAISSALFSSNPGFLGSAFALGTQRMIGWTAVAISLAAGILAAQLAVLAPLLASIAAGVPTRALRTARRPRILPWASVLALVCLTAAVVILLVAPAQAILGMLLLTVALLGALPALLSLTVGLLARLARARTGAASHIAAAELRASRTGALAVAATCAVAVFGAVAIGGAHADLLAGLKDAAREENAFTDIWVSPPGAYDLLRTTPFPGGARARLAALPGVRSLAVYRGGLLDWRKRRVWVIAPPSDTDPLVPSTQLLQGNAAQAASRLRTGSWITLSKALAAEHHLHIGSRFTLPSPHPLNVRVAALTGNIGWPPGAIITTAGVYARGWSSTEPSAYLIRLAPGASAAGAIGQIDRTAGPGLTAQSAAAHEAQQNHLSEQGLQRLSQIAILILAVAVLASAAALASMISQRRPRLAKLKLEGFSRRELWGTVLLEALVLLALACFCGALFGLLAQQMLDRALSQVINFPVVQSLALPTALLSVAVVTVTAAVIVAIPGYAAAGVPAALALED